MYNAKKPIMHESSTFKETSSGLMSLRYIIFTMVVFALLIFATLNRHRHGDMYNYHSEIFSDKAGYQVYLPSAFLYQFDAKQFPDSIEFKTGEGFTLNRESGKVFTKYPYGVALLQVPFFLSAHIWCLSQEPNNATGYSRPYHTATNLAAVTYLLLGLIAMFQYLRSYFKEKIVLISLAIYLFGTNLYYYGIAETGLSHVYSFFATALLLLLSQSLNRSNTLRFAIGTGLAAGLMIALRPLNLLFVPLVFLVGCEFNFRLLTFRNLFIMAASAAIPVFPQLLYYHYLSGSFFIFSYGNESFIYLTAPKIKEVLFAFENGWLLYHPIHLFSIFGLFLLRKTKPKESIAILLVILAATYLYASWWSWMLGCGLGHRGYIDFFPLLLISFTYLLNNIWHMPKLRYSALLVCFIFIALSLKLVYTFDGCWYGKDSWDYHEYFRLITSPTI